MDPHDERPFPDSLAKTLHKAGYFAAPAQHWQSLSAVFKRRPQWRVPKP
jgi:hypothetical protein